MLSFLLACHPPTSTPSDVTPEDAPVTTVVVEAGTLSSDLVCHLPGDPEEDHHITADAEGNWSIEGLLADETYVCTSGLERFHVTTDPLPAHIPETLVTADDPTSEYRLFGHFYQDPENQRSVRDHTILIVDAEGRVRWYHELEDQATVVDANWHDGLVAISGGVNPPSAVNLAGETVWEIPARDSHHDLDVLSNGQVAVLVGVPAPDVFGYGVEIYEVGKSKPVWTAYSEDMNLEPSLQAYDAWHANAMQVDEVDGRLEGIWVNLRAANQLVRIDPGLRDIVQVVDHEWRFVDESGGIARPFDHAHDPHIDGDEVIFYDNGTNGEPSRIVSFELDSGSETAIQTFEWLEADWSESIWGSVDPRPDGRLLVGRGHCIDCNGAGDGPSQLVEVDPDSGDVLWRLELEELSGVYRARGIDGCDIFSNRRYCAD
ncbi:MAG: hypothetical protein GY913_07140 [Proteobacteria bacterium]|nr:hypothetical protein [Pseudomonadota bacterium]